MNYFEKRERVFRHFEDAKCHLLMADRLLDRYEEAYSSSPNPVTRADFETAVQGYLNAGNLFVIARHNLWSFLGI